MIINPKSLMAHYKDYLMRRDLSGLYVVSPKPKRKSAKEPLVNGKRHCTWCGKMFRPKSPNGVLCSDGCRRLAQLKRDKECRAKKKAAPNGNSEAADRK